MSATDPVAVMVVAHAPLASAYLHVAKHVHGDCQECLQVLDVPPEWSLVKTVAELEALLQRWGSRPVLFLVDVPGATPANAVRAVLGHRTDCRAVAGLNVPMLWRSLCYGREPLDSLTARALAGGPAAIVEIS